MRSITCLVIVAVVLAAGAFGLTAVQAAEQQTATVQDQSCYAFHNGEWWYWLPAGRWVYWRNNQWNNYDPKTFTSNNSAAVAADAVPSRWANQAPDGSDTHPFYGRVVAGPERRPVQPNSEIGPFYGNVLPNEFFGSARGRRWIGPFSGRGVN